MEIWTSIVGLLLLVYIWLRSIDYLERKYLPPGPRGWPVVGNLLELAGKLPHQQLMLLSREYGPLLFLKLGAFPTIVANSPETAQEILKTRDRIFANRPPSMGELFFFNQLDVLSTAHGQFWRSLRRLCAAEIFSPNRLASTQDVREMVILRVVQQMLQEGSKGKIANVYEKAIEVNFNIITHRLFGTGCYGLKIRDSQGRQKELEQLLHEIPFLAGNFAIYEFIPWLRCLDTQMQTTLSGLRREFSDFVTQILEKRRDSCRDLNGATRDVTDAFLELQKTDGEKYSDHVIDANLATLILGGTDTSSVQVHWMLSEILRNPEVKQKLVEELDKVIGMERLVLESDLDELPYLESVLMESFRLHPVAPLGIPHYSSEATTVAGFHIPKHTRALINVYAIGRSPELWENPTKFDPTRFLNKSVDPKGLDFRILPFGAGRRGCPGATLGIRMVSLTVAQILHACDVRLPEGMKHSDLDMEEVFGNTLNRKNPLLIRVSPRLPLRVYAPAGISVD